MSIDKNIEAIQLLKKLQEEERRTATRQEMEILSQFNGWGAMWEVFRKSHPRYLQLKSILTPEEYHAASASTVNAYYTNPIVVEAIWNVLLHLGISGEIRALEPSCGIGYFIKANPIEEIQWTGVELEPIAAGIAKYLCPKAEIFNQGFETAPFPDDYFDLVVGNVPFGSYNVHEPRYKGMYIHNHFLMKSIDLVREGGLVALITSTGTLDSPSNEIVRQELFLKARLIAAFRFPSGTMKNAKTDVTTDFLILQKGKFAESPTWLGTSEYEGFPLNNYWKEHPEHLLGELSVCKLYGGRLGLKSTGIDTVAKMQELVGKLGKYFHAKEEPQKPKLTIPIEFQHLPVGSHVRVGDIAYIREKNEMVKVDPKHQARVLALLEVLEALETLLTAQLKSNQPVETLRQELNDRYDAFIRKFGALRGTGNKIISGDPKYELLKSLENEKLKKTAIFFERTTQGYSPPDRCDSAKDALLHCLNTLGKVDLEWIAVRC